MSEWQPIETAPKDGTLKLFYAPLSGCFIAPDDEPAPVTRDEARRLYEVCGAWPNVGYNPTHWMPLPEAPK